MLFSNAQYLHVTILTIPEKVQTCRDTTQTFDKVMMTLIRKKKMTYYKLWPTTVVAPGAIS